MADNESAAPRGYFPGSRQPLPAATVAPKKVRSSEPVSWDARPVKKLVNGQYVEFFSIGAVCAALGRPAVTIRLWIKQQRLPAATYRMPDRNGIAGRRLYTRAQIESLIEVAEKHGILGNNRVDWSQHGSFADDVRKAWAQLK